MRIQVLKMPFNFEKSMRKHSQKFYFFTFFQKKSTKKGGILNLRIRIQIILEMPGPNIMIRIRNPRQKRHKSTDNGQITCTKICSSELMIKDKGP